MESVAHSRQPNKVAVTFPHKINNNGSFSGKNLYDDVYGVPPKFGVSNLSPRFEDYGEIFGSFHTARSSSIPVLDLPVVHETEAFFDPQNDAFNYTEVFNALDCAVSYENLFHQPFALDGVSSVDAWTPADTDSFTGELDHSANNLSVPYGDVFHSLDHNKEINIPYHKINGTSNGYLSKGNHMSQLHAVPCFSQAYDEKTRLHKTDPSFQVADNSDLDMEFSAGKVKGNYLTKTRPQSHNFTSGEQTFGIGLNLQSGCNRNDFHSSEMFITVSDISLRSMPSQVPPPSRPPPVALLKMGNTSKLHSNIGLVASKETPGDSSLPFYDVEVDLNPPAAASSDVMKDAILRAEAKLHSAKETKERKKWDFESHVKSSFDVKNDEAKMSSNVSLSNCLIDETTQEKRHSKTKIAIKDERQKPWNASPGTPDTIEGKRILNMFEENHTEQSRSSQGSDRSTGVGSCKEESEFFELVGTEESGTIVQPPKQTKFLVQGTRTQEHGQKDREASYIKEKHKNVKEIEEKYQGAEYEKNSEAAKDLYERGKNIMKSEASNEKWRQREHVKKEKVSQIFELEQNQKTIRVIHQHGRTKKEEPETDQSGTFEDVSEMGHKEHKQVEMQKPKQVDRQAPNEVQLGMRLKENKKELKQVGKQQLSVKLPKQSEKMTENGKTQRDAFTLGQAGDEEKLEDLVEQDDINERSNMVFKQDNIEEKEVCRRDKEMRLKPDKLIQIKKELKETYETGENEKSLKSSSRKDERDEGLKHTFGWDGNDKRLKEGFELEEQNYGILNNTSRNDENERTSNKAFDTKGLVTVSKENNYHIDVGRVDNDKGLVIALEEMEWNEEVENKKFAKATGETCLIECDKNLAGQSTSNQEGNIGKLEVSQESVANQEIGKTTTECKVGENKFEEIEIESQPTNEKIGAPQMTSGDTEHLGTPKADYRRSTEAAKLATVKEAVNFQNTSQWVHAGQSTQKKEQSHNEIDETVVIVAERLRRERESEKDCLRKIEEERDRERKREKDRMAVDKAILEAEREREREREKDRMAVDREAFEARDRAYADAYERSEKAAFERSTLEAQQRALAEARERLEKVCAEARCKLYIDDKETTEARLKAEHAALERETPEAQECAMEKLKGDIAAFESREWLERSVSDKIGVYFQNGGRQDSSFSEMLDSKFQNFADPRYPYSLYSASFSERSQREGESAQRCRARLERHRRTAERAAKALAEKHMRDLLVQKEQAERNRIAETLDAEVRRWSGGKEGNLRALLSTLQYILGPDSGWQPIPLTEVITSAAVKKAYRKATLCVHPDKLQQRGASIQHKYICEKVFDLLKDAWNKFNSEER